MPSGASGVAQFVGNKAFEHNADGGNLNANELARRKTLASNAKIQPKSSLTYFGRSQLLPDRRTAPLAPQYDQPAGRIETGGEDLFEASDLEDSDDTTRDLDLQISGGHQARSSFHIQQDSDGGLEVEQDLGLQNSLEVGENGNREYNNDYTHGAPKYLNEDGVQSNIILHLNDKATVDPHTLEVMRQKMSMALASEQYKKGEKLISIRSGSNHYPSMMPSRSGRFVPAHAPSPDFHGEEEEMDYVNEARHQTAAQWKYQSLVTAGYVDGDMTDGRTNVEHVAKDNHGQPHDAEYAIRNQASFEHGSNGSLSSGESSPTGSSQHTPRAEKALKEPPTTSSIPEKRTRTRLELDYDETLLRSMKYSELKDQPFDANPRLPDDGISVPLKDPKTSLKALLENMKSLHQDDQRAFFLRMPLKKWEEAGDWFLERFGDVMMKIREARRSKRDVSKRFEQELADREESVRDQTKNILEVFKKMKQGGEGVLTGTLP